MLQRTDEIAVRVGPYDLSEDCLPDKPSALIRVALADLERTLLNQHYYFEIGEYHAPNASGRCEICLAGGVIAQSVGMGPHKVGGTYGENRSSNSIKKLEALSAFAFGNTCAGLKEMGLPYVGFEKHRRHNIWALDTLKPQLETLAADLEVAGL